jgi:hypothetical protein
MVVLTRKTSQICHQQRSRVPCWRPQIGHYAHWHAGANNTQDLSATENLGVLSGSNPLLSSISPHLLPICYKWSYHKFALWKLKESFLSKSFLTSCWEWEPQRIANNQQKSTHLFWKWRGESAPKGEPTAIRESPRFLGSAIKYLACICI